MSGSTQCEQSPVVLDAWHAGLARIAELVAARNAKWQPGAVPTVGTTQTPSLYFGMIAASLSCLYEPRGGCGEHTDGDVTERHASDDELLTTGEVAVLFRVHRRTVTEWEKIGKLRAIRTPGGHRRYYRRDVERAVAQALAQDPD